MKSFLFVCILAFISQTVIFGQRVGIGTNSPMARLAIDSGLLIDQNNANQGQMVPGLVFGEDMKAGISSSKLNGSSLRSGLSFYTNATRRMAIDSMGNMAIGSSPQTGYRLYVSGAVYNSSLDVSNILTAGSTIFANNKIVINTDVNHNALLYMKGRPSTPGNWGQHIVMEAVSSSDSGAILYDGDMKFRTFGTGDSYFFRDADNANLMRINGTGSVTVLENISAGGTITTGGNGIVQNVNSQQLKIGMYTSPSTIDFTLNGGSHVSVIPSFHSYDFTSPPTILMAYLEENPSLGSSNFTNPNGIVYSINNVTNTQCTVVIRNVSGVQSTGSDLRLKLVLLGNL